MDIKPQSIPSSVFAEKYKVLFVNDDPINTKRMLNGEMVVHTSPGKGTRVVFTVPCSADFSGTTNG